MDTQINNAILQVIATIRSIANPIAILAVVIMGIYLIVGHDDQTIRVVKRWAISIAVGLILINLAEPIVNWLQTIH
ncbi:MAG: TrbC/VirB2 family protein [Erysipelotrichaceae bacterium]|nr:TrbC/VirB2 family protein [Erysipelotrichaceae bacterium]